MKKLSTLLFASLMATLTMAQIPTNGLISNWTFNNGDANDETGSNDGTVYGATLTTDRFGNENMAYDFDGIDDYIEFGPDIIPIKNTNTDWSISFWFKIPDPLVNTPQFIFSQQPSYDRGVYYTVSKNPMTQQISAGFSINYPGNGMGIGDDVSMQIGEWKHYVITYKFNSSSSATMNYYINGIASIFPVEIVPSNYGYSAPDTLVFGKALYFSNSNYTGTIDDIYIYNRTLNDSEIMALNNDVNPLFATIHEMNKNQIKMYPNPANQTLNIELHSSDQVFITDLSGSVVLESNVSLIHSVDVSSLSKGIYLVKTASGATQKFIKL